MGSAERRQREREMKKNDILDAAQRLFFRKGYENTSMDEVAKEAEYSKRTVYIYFSGKEQIYFEIMIRGYRLLIRMMEESLPEQKPRDAVEKLRCIFLTFFRFSKEHSEYFKAILEYEAKGPQEQTAVEKETRDECYRLGEQIFGYITAALRQGVEEGSLQSGLDIERTALILWACTIGVFTTGEKKSQYLTDFHNTQPDDFITAAFELMLLSMRRDRRNEHDS